MKISRILHFLVDVIVIIKVEKKWLWAIAITVIVSLDLPSLSRNAYRAERIDVSLTGQSITI